MSVKKLLYFLICISFTGCASYNVEWAKSNNIFIREVNAPIGKWNENNFENFLTALEKESNRDLRWVNGMPNMVVVVHVPANYWNFVVRYYRISYRVNQRVNCFYISPIVIFTMEDISCLDHEIGYLREYLEGVPYHSKYAW